MSKLNISEDLKLPLEAVTQTFAILAKRGVGKTYTGAVLVEEMLAARQQVVVADPIGVWWGLRSSADGKSAGFAIVVFGGEHADVPLDENAGEVIAGAIVEHGFSAILDLSLLRKGAQVRFMTAFAETLYRLNRKPLHFAVDEADAFAPQRPLPGEQRLLGAFEDIVRRGRARGLGVTLITQRAAVLNKNVLTQIEVLVVLRTISPQDREAIESWTEIHGAPKQLAQLSESLASLPIGNAWFWSPGWLDIFKRVQVRKRITFDSSSTPKVGEKVVAPKELAAVDLEQLGEQIKQTAAKAKENDPAELKRQLTIAKRELADLQKVKPTPKETVKEVPALTKEERELLKDVATAADDLDMSLQEVSDDIKKLMGLQPLLHKLTAEKFSLPGQSAPRATVVAATRPSAAKISTPAPRIHAPPVDNGELTNPQVKILQIVNMLRARGLTPNRDMIARWHDKGDRGLHPNTGSYGQNLARLREGGYLNGCEPTAKAHAYNSLPTGLDAARAVLSNPQQAIFDQLCNGEELDRESLAEKLGLHPNTGSYGQNLARLRTMGLLPERGTIKLTEAASL